MRSRLGIKTLALCGLVVGLMAMTASSAHATLNAHWWIVNSSNQLVDASTLNATVGTKPDPGQTLKLLTKIAGIHVEFVCTTVSLEGTVLKGNGTVGTGARALYNGCLTELNGSASAVCQPKSSDGPGTILTRALHGLIILHQLAGGAKDHLVELLPDEGEIFATIEMGAECAIGTKVNVIGPKATLEDCNGEFLVHKIEHLVQPGPLTELWTISKTAEHVAKLSGSVFVKLLGTHEGLKFSGTTL